MSIDLNFHTQFWCFTINKGLIIKNRVNFFVYRHFESEALSRSPRQPSMESRIWRLEKFKLVSNGIWSRDQSDLYLHTHPKMASYLLNVVMFRFVLHWNIANFSTVVKGTFFLNVKSFPGYRKISNSSITYVTYYEEK